MVMTMNLYVIREEKSNIHSHGNANSPQVVNFSTHKFPFPPCTISQMVTDGKENIKLGVGLAI